MQEQRGDAAQTEPFEAYGEYQPGAAAPEQPPAAETAQGAQRAPKARRSHFLLRFLVLLAVIAEPAHSMGLSTSKIEPAAKWK